MPRVVYEKTGCENIGEGICRKADMIARQEGKAKRRANLKARNLYREAVELKPIKGE